MRLASLLNSKGRAISMQPNGVVLHACSASVQKTSLLGRHASTAAAAAGWQTCFCWKPPQGRLPPDAVGSGTGTYVDVGEAAAGFRDARVVEFGREAGLRRVLLVLMLLLVLDWRVLLLVLDCVLLVLRRLAPAVTVDALLPPLCRATAGLGMGEELGDRRELNSCRGAGFANRPCDRSFPCGGELATAAPVFCILCVVLLEKSCC